MAAISPAIATALVSVRIESSKGAFTFDTEVALNAPDLTSQLKQALDKASLKLQPSEGLSLLRGE